MAAHAPEPHTHGEAHAHPTVPASSRAALWASLGARVLLSLAGAAGLVLSAFLSWTGGRSGVNMDVRSLWDEGAFGASTGSFVETVGFAAIVLGLLAIVGLAPRSGWLTRLAGAVAVAGSILFVVQATRAGGGVSDVGPGAWVALVAGVVALVGGFFGTRAAPAAPGAPVG
ncbi:MAG TPA: sugar:proton symporter [Actinomycetota bacterium]|nr:sugar:proton symporter [Actinomycetota bacterium]